MADYGGYTLAQVQAAIEPGQPATFDTAAKAFAAALKGLQTLQTEIPPAVKAVTGGPWIGPAAQAFTGAVETFIAFIGETVGPLGPYEGAMTSGGAALTEAQSTLAAYVAKVEEYRADMAARGLTPDEEKINAEARKILIKLAAAYVTAAGKLTAVPETPEQVVKPGGDDPTVKPTADDDNQNEPPATDNPAPQQPPLTQPPFTSFQTSTDDPTSQPPNLLTLGRTTGDENPSTVLTSFAPSTAPAISLGPLSGGESTSLTGFGALTVGGTPTQTSLTNAHLPGLGAGASAPASVMPPRGGSTLGNGLLGGPGERQRRPLPPKVTDPDEDDEQAERDNALPGDAEWTEPGGLDGALGRPRPATAAN